MFAPDTKIKPAFPATKGKQPKYFDTYYPLLSSVVTPGYADLTVITQGVQQSERVGELIKLIKAEVSLTAANFTSDEFASMRMVTFLWKQDNAISTPGSGSILEDPLTWSTLSPYNWQGRQKYRVLTDRIYALVGGTLNTSKTFVVDKFEIDLSGIVTQFNGTATTGTDHIYFFHMSDSALPPSPTARLHIRVWYSD